MASIHNCRRPLLRKPQSCRHIMLTVSVLLLLPCLAPAQEHQHQQQQDHQAQYQHYDHAVTAAPAQVREQLDDFLESVGHLTSDAKATHDKKDVVDLGQSLHIIEGKFDLLRGAILNELGAAAQQHPDGAAALHGHTQDLVRAGAEMVSRMGKSRGDILNFVGEVGQLGAIVSEVRQTLKKLENDVATLQHGLEQAQVDASVVRDAHLGMRNTLGYLRQQTDYVLDVHSQHISYIPKWYYVVILETIALIVFALFKRYRMGPRGGKFNKLG